MNGPTPSDPNQPQQTQNQQQAAPPPANPADPAALEQKFLQDVFGGKYQTVEDAKKGHWELNNYAAQANEALRQMVNPSVPQQPVVDPFKRLQDESMIPSDVLREAVRTEAKRLVQDELAPILGAVSARQQMAVSAPEYLENEPAILKWLSQNRTASEKVQRLNEARLYDLAAEVSFNLWRSANPPAHAGNPEARAQAQLPNQQSAGQQQLQQQLTPQQSQEVLAQAIRYGHLTGDRRPAYSMVFPDFEFQIPPHLADQLQR